MAKSTEPNRRQEILDAARAVFKENGFEKAHMSEIAERSGVAKGTVYLYFNSKLALLDALCNHYQELVADAIAEPLKNPDTAEAIEGVVKTVFRVAAREKDLLQLLDLRLGLHIRDRDMENPGAQEKMKEFFTERMERGDIVGYDPLIITELSGGFVQWMIKVSLLWRHKNIKPQYEDTAIRMLQRAFLSPPLPIHKNK
jgi:AcrR family transcriptional regulator